MSCRKQRIRELLQQRRAARRRRRMRALLAVVSLGLCVAMAVRSGASEPVAGTKAAVADKTVTTVAPRRTRRTPPPAASEPPALETRDVAQSIAPLAVAEPPATEPLEGPVPWLGVLRRQVAGRAWMLSDCFIGAPEPGALLWTATVDATTGTVHDAVIDAEHPLQPDQEHCVLTALSREPFRMVPSGVPRARVQLTLTW